MERITEPMIEEIASVVAVDDGGVWVETRRRSACGHCDSASVCGVSALAKLFGEGRNRLRIADPAGLRLGDRVVIGIPDGTLVRASLIAYLLPVIALVAAAAIGTALHLAEGAVALFGLAGLGSGLWLGGRITGGVAGRERYRPTLIRRAGEPGGIRLADIHSPIET
ncbi:SoxR reducing system RseC family protein [Thiocystis violascens]|uniref:Positive regulator of sigma E activity n=1 Tax=Thiocystis violascens (strain ATCC 17096 / DSM 198 / 6111) TaxID=765911 RepID=I3YCD7_THIV6|nr:SoxR reducing system RseC family protein [Thiocystis violascens]AFL74655.1 Positive regulator of sigma E activity [Thiocystis violascens DSM 198]